MGSYYDEWLKFTQGKGLGKEPDAVDNMNKAQDEKQEEETDWRKCYQKWIDGGRK